MKLLEFFNIPNDNPSKFDVQGKSQEDKNKIQDDLYWFIIDNDDLHKQFVLPFVSDLKAHLSQPDFNVNRFKKNWVPMINKGCRMYYNDKKLKSNPDSLFTKELKKNLLDKITDKYIDDIKNNSYDIGEHKI